MNAQELRSRFPELYDEIYQEGYRTATQQGKNNGAQDINSKIQMAAMVGALGGSTFPGISQGSSYSVVNSASGTGSNDGHFNISNEAKVLYNKYFRGSKYSYTVEDVADLLKGIESIKNVNERKSKLQSIKMSSTDEIALAIAMSKRR